MNDGELAEISAFLISDEFKFTIQIAPVKTLERMRSASIRILDNPYCANSFDRSDRITRLALLNAEIARRIRRETIINSAIDRMNAEIASLTQQRLAK